MITTSLPKFIRGQQAAINSIVSAFSVWESNNKAGGSKPLVLAVVGPTGVGKTATGNVCNY